MGCKIFIGSSSEGLEHANKIKALLQQPGVDAELWTAFFSPGLLTFEALETMLRQCCGAVFVITGDDMCHVRGQDVPLPRANTMLEFGLVAGRMGRENIALCHYWGVPPSDLTGMTVIPMMPGSETMRCLPSAAVTDLDAFRASAEGRLVSWASTLSRTAEGIARTKVVHGYTGRWEFKIELQKWRSLSVSLPSQAGVIGNLDLFMPAHGQSGMGQVQGRLQFEIHEQAPGEAGVYEGEYHVTHEILSAASGKDGSLILTTEGFALGVVTGHPPPQLGHLQFQPWTATWRLSRSSEPRKLVGEFEMKDTQGQVEIWQQDREA